MAELITNYTRRMWENSPSIATPINETNLNAMDAGIDNLQTDTRTLNIAKAEQADLLQSLKAIDYNDQTGVFVFHWWNGTTKTVDLHTEAIPVHFEMDEHGVITMRTFDGTEYTADVSGLIKTYTFVDSQTIDFTVTTDAEGHKTITADIVAGSITADKLQPNYLADVTTQANNASASAAISAQKAGESSVSATDAEAWAVGQRGGVDVPDTDPTYQNNSKHWSRQSAAQTMDALQDVSLPTPIPDGTMLRYNVTTEKWENIKILSKENGGIGNNRGYIQTGKGNTGTASQTATLEGLANSASTACSHAEGERNVISGQGKYAHVEGYNNRTFSSCSHVGGYGVETETHMCAFAHGCDGNNTSFNRVYERKFSDAMPDAKLHGFIFGYVPTHNSELTAETPLHISGSETVQIDAALGASATIGDSAKVSLILHPGAIYLLICNSFTVTTGALYGATARMISCLPTETGTPNNLSLGQTTNAPATIAMAANHVVTIQNGAAARATQFTLIRVA